VAAAQCLELESDQQQFLSIADPAQSGLDLTSDFTIEMWVNFEEQTGGGVKSRQTLVDKRDSDPETDRAYLIEVFELPGSVPVVLSRDGSGGAETVALFSWFPNPNHWYHVAFVYDADGDAPHGRVEFFIDGVSQGTVGSQVPSIHDSPASFNIGATNSPVPPDAQRFFDGKIADVRVWSVERSAADIAENFSKELTGVEIGLEGYWRFEGNFLDTSTNGNHLTAVNAPLFCSDPPVVEPCDDTDHDGFGSPGSAVCPEGAAEDCNDLDASTHPGAPELCDGSDNDCDGSPAAEESDADDDGFRICANDCNDLASAVNPGALELPGNAVDENCDGSLGSCDPFASWRNHGQFVRCVAQEVNVLREQQQISEPDGDQLVESAAQSDVGR
jgi:hypothetical protein